MIQPNQELWSEFIDAVRARKVSGIELHNYGDDYCLKTASDSIWFRLMKGCPSMPDAPVDHLCAEIRRQMATMDYCVVPFYALLEVCKFTESMMSDSTYFKDELELDRHLRAVLWILKQEEADGS